MAKKTKEVMIDGLTIKQWSEEAKFQTKLVGLREARIRVLEGQLRESVGPLHKIQRQRISSAILGTAEGLLSTSDVQLPTRHALNRALAGDYIELAELFLPADVLEHGKKNQNSAFERSEIKRKAEDQIREIIKRDIG